MAGVAGQRRAAKLVRDYATYVAADALRRFGTVLAATTADPTIDEVSVNAKGQVIDAHRNGLPPSKIIKAGDGKVFTVTPGEYDDYTSKSVVKVVAFRLFDGYLQMMVEYDNRTSKAADVAPSNYVAGGVQYDIFVSASTEPGVKRVVVLGGEVPGAKQLAAGRIKALINNTEVEIAVPALG